MERSHSELEWTPELVGRFWDNWASRSELADQYFTFQVGAEIVKFLECIEPIAGKRVLDYGCGPGFLTEHLLSAGAVVAAADYSTETIRAANARSAGKPGWEGAVLTVNGTLAVPDGSFDLITCIETIEHMFDGPRRDLLREFYRLLKVGGRIMFTTPNEEDLAASSVFCPNCQRTFHNMQHLCSWSASALSEFLEENGFGVEYCAGINLYNWGQRPRKRLLDTSPRDVLRGIRNQVRGLWDETLDHLAPRPFPQGRAFRRKSLTYDPMHLVAIAVKKVGGK
jgi:2-polyprenyl-3-methyl-5-hydroxy-6-metoxy-1,4-benzoquinol methylase